MATNKKALIHKLLKGIETGDPESAAVVNENKYIQHNPQTHEGSEGLAALFKRLSLTNPRVNLVRTFEDADFVFAHTEYDFAKRNIGFEVFRFEDGKAVEHWDNIQRRLGPNPAGHSMVDGATEICDLELTEANRARVSAFTKEVLINKQLDQLDSYINTENYTEHNPHLNDDINSLKQALALDSETLINYQKCHRLLAEGNFVLAVCEGYAGDHHSSFYDLYRLDNNKIVEHWDTRETIADPSEWKNNNGKF